MAILYQSKMQEARFLLNTAAANFFNFQKSIYLLQTQKNSGILVLTICLESSSKNKNLNRFFVKFKKKHIF